MYNGKTGSLRIFFWLSGWSYLKLNSSQHFRRIEAWCWFSLVFLQMSVYCQYQDVAPGWSWSETTKPEGKSCFLFQNFFWWKLVNVYIKFAIFWLQRHLNSLDFEKLTLLRDYSKWLQCFVEWRIWSFLSHKT